MTGFFNPQVRQPGACPCLQPLPLPVPVPHRTPACSESRPGAPGAASQRPRAPALTQLAPAHHQLPPTHAPTPPPRPLGMQGFLTAMKQEVNRRHAADKWALDDVVMTSEVTHPPKDVESLKEAPQEGVYVYGLYLDG
jgi:hypothetical protein